MYYPLLHTHLFEFNINPSTHAVHKILEVHAEHYLGQLIQTLSLNE